MKSKKVWLVILLIIIAIAVYLNRSYAYFYAYFGKYNLQRPTQEQNFYMPDNQNIQYSYVALGDSLTAGVGASTSSEAFPNLLLEKLATKNGPTQLLNLAVPGATTKDVLDGQIKTAIDFKPDLITLLIGINDMHNHVSISDFQENYENILNQLTGQFPKPKVIVINLPFIGSNLLLPPYGLYFDNQTQKYNKVIKSLADKYQVTYFDLYSQTKDQFKKDKNLYSQDLFHPSGAGYKVWSDLLTPSL